MCLTLECVCVFQSWKWPDWAQTETLQIWHSLSQSYMETPSSCQPALSNSMAEMVRNLILSVPLALKSMTLPLLSFCLIHLQWFFKKVLLLTFSPLILVYFCFKLTFTSCTSFTFLCVLLKVRSEWPLSCTGTWAPTYLQKMQVWDSAARRSILITLLLSTLQSSWHQ